MAYEAGRDSQARVDAGDTYKTAPPSAAPHFAANKLNEEDYRGPGDKGGPGRAAITPPPSVQMQPEDQRPGFAVAPPGHGPGHK